MGRRNGQDENDRKIGKQREIKKQIMNKENIHKDGLSVANSVFGSSPSMPDVGFRSGALESLGIWLK